MMRDAPFRQLKRPSPMALKGRRVLILGLGDTGLSVARFVERQAGVPRVADTRAEPPARRHYTGELATGPFSPALLEGADLVCISPGLPLAQPLIQDAMARGIPVLGDVELFAWHNSAPVIAVTGTNGKTTVTALAGHLLRESGVDCEVAGNIAPPVLEAWLAREKPPSAWVLELSSYQLETTWSLAPRAAAMLNLTEDHFDRYAGLDDYAAAKARIFQGAGTQILNRDDPRSMAMALPGRRAITFGTDGDFHCSAGFLHFRHEKILAAAELQIRGAHNAANALAACALAFCMDVSLENIAAGLKSFKGLPHRLELVATKRGKEWYDDSKGTNVGATVAALEGLGKRTVLVLGGEGKGQDFSPLRKPVAQFAAKVLLIGRDAPLIEQALAGLPTERCATLQEAVEKAAAIDAQAVLLSPACASFDMFRDYKRRGEVFAAAVRRLPA